MRCGGNGMAWHGERMIVNHNDENNNGDASETAPKGCVV
jgi:hypothetical protein